MRALALLHNRLCALIPVWNALSSARTVLDNDMPMADDAQRVQRHLREVLQKGVDAMDRLRIREGKELAGSDSDGYVGYVRRAIKACEEDAEEESAEES